MCIRDRPYTDVVRDGLLTPLGITDMTIGPTYGTGPSDVFHWTRANANYMDVLGPSGSWVATAADVVRITDSLDAGKRGFHPLSPGLADVMRSRSPFPYSPDRWYGLGLICFTDGTWGHTGTLESAHDLLVHRTDGYSYAVLVSGNEPRETDDLIAIFNAAFDGSGVRSFL